MQEPHAAQEAQTLEEPKGVTVVVPASKAQEATGIERAVGIFLKADPDANWETVAGQMYRALRGKGTDCRWDLAPEVIALAHRLGYQALFHEEGVTVKRAPADPRDTWGFASVKTALSWLKQKEEGRV